MYFIHQKLRVIKAEFLSDADKKIKKAPKNPGLLIRLPIRFQFIFMNLLTWVAFFDEATIIYTPLFKSPIG